MSCFVPSYDDDSVPLPSFEWPMIVESRQKFLRYVNHYLKYEINSFVELGVYKGDFSRMILDVISPEKLILVDPFITSLSTVYGDKMNNLPTCYSTELDYAEVVNRFSKEITEGQVEVISDYSYEAVKEIEDGSLDVVYVDASHLYEHVKRDLNDWLPKLKPTGLICGHDYVEHESFGVIKAVNDFCNENNFEMIIFNKHGGDFALRRK